MMLPCRLIVPIFRHSFKLYSTVQHQTLRRVCSVLESSSSNSNDGGSQQPSEASFTDGRKIPVDCVPNINTGLHISGSKLIVEGENIPEPWDSLDCYDWPETVKEYLKRKEIIKPTTIQSQVWPIALQKRDLVGVSTTGSGKTLAFVLPALVHVELMAEKNKRYIGPNVVILTPTRELAQQINQIFIEIGLHLPVCLIGGSARRVQAQSLATRRPAIVISTPGRLNDFIDEKNIELSKANFIVIDEADRMLELGFEAQIRRIIDRTPKPPYTKQTLLFSATWPKEVKDLAIDFLRDYVQINVGSSKLLANPRIEQNFIFPEPEIKAKETALLNLLKDLDDGSKILIFVSTKKGADYLQRWLSSNGFNSMSIHGDRPQHTRNLMIDAFREGRRSILIGTDIASRGLDIDDISIIINYDMPNSVEDYVHRIGRTARFEKSGTSYSLFMPEDSRLAVGLVDLLKESKQKVDPKLIDYARLASRQQQSRDKMGYQRYSTPVKQRIIDRQNIMTNYRKMIYK